MLLSANEDIRPTFSYSGKLMSPAFLDVLYNISSWGQPHGLVVRVWYAVLCRPGFQGSDLGHRPTPLNSHAEGATLM